ncbi:MAG: glyoxylate/hydroxypyruvate reductase A [Sulfitobacter sp.]
MSINVLFAAQYERWETYRPALMAAFQAAGLDVNLQTDLPADQVDYIIYAPNSAVQDFTPFTRAKAVLNLWAGVEAVVGNETLTIPLARMVDPGMTQSMTEWVMGHVLRHHLGMDAHIHNPTSEWSPQPVPLAQERRVTVLGLGELGRHVAKALAGFGFNVTGWSRSPKTIEGIATLHGADGLDRALGTAEILVLLLPDTAATTNVLNARTLALMPKGSVIINPGRGPLIDDAALLSALDTGHIGHATLDVFRVEPLPEDHPFWSHPKITVTPHVAAETRPRTASKIIAENIKRGEAGAPFLHLVNRERGY